MVRAPDGELWLGADSGLYRLSALDFPDSRMPEERLATVGIDGTLWFGANNGVWRYRDDDFVNFNRDHGLPSDVVGGMHTLGDGRLLAVTDGGDAGAVIFNGERFEPWEPGAERLDGVDCHDVTEDPHGHFWVATDEGVFRTDGTSWIMIDERDGLPENHARSIHATADGDVWIGTQGGVTRLGTKSTPVQSSMK